MEFLGFLKGNRRRVVNSMTMGPDKVLHTESVVTPGGATLKREEGKLEASGPEGSEDQLHNPASVVHFPGKA